MVPEPGDTNMDDEIIDANVFKNMQRWERIAAVPNWEHSPAQGFFLLEGSFSGQCCLLARGSGFGSHLSHLETTLIVIEDL